MPLLEQPVPAPLAANVLLNPRLFPVNRAQLWASGSQTIDSILEAPGSVVTVPGAALFRQQAHQENGPGAKATSHNGESVVWA